MTKTIFLTMSRGVIARNIMQTNVLRLLKEAGHRLVILTPAFRNEKFLKEFAAPNVFFENLVEPKWGFWDWVLVGCHKALAYNDSTKLRDLCGIPGTGKAEKGSFFKFMVKKVFLWPISKIQPLKDAARWLDKILVKGRYYKEIFDKYNPDLVFSTSVIEDADVFVLKQAQARKIKTVGMPRSWDNLSKTNARALPDKLLVWGEFSRDEAVRFHHAKKENIIICGIPQFDFYHREDYLMSREEFCRAYGIDPNKKIILFCSEGKYTPRDGEVAEIVSNFINRGELARDAVLFIRPHFLFLGDEKKFAALEGKPNVFVDRGYNHSAIFRDNWDYGEEQIKKFTNMVRHADIVITSVSSISLDAATVNKPIINVKFDGYATLPFKKSVARIYMYEHYKLVARSGGVWIVHNEQELRKVINSYFLNPQLLSDGRRKLRDYWCHKIDGRSGRRLAEAVLELLA